MDPSFFPTKGNLILAKNTLKLCKQGYDLLDKKRNVLIKEIMELDNTAKQIQSKIESTFTQAYSALQKANIDIGISDVEHFSFGVAQETNVSIKARSIMGVEIPIVRIEDDSSKDKPPFSFLDTSSSLDDAYKKFESVKEFILELSMIENAAYRLAISISKTQKRANALKNVTIPRYEILVKHIQETLEERERDEFTRLKVIKSRKN